MDTADELMINELEQLVGNDNPDNQKYEQKVGAASITKKVYGFKAMGGNAVISVLTYADGTDGIASLGTGGIAYEGEFYAGDYKVITWTSGNVKGYLKKQ